MPFELLPMVFALMVAVFLSVAVGSSLIAYALLVILAALVWSARGR